MLISVFLFCNHIYYSGYFPRSGFFLWGEQTVFKSTSNILYGFVFLFFVFVFVFYLSSFDLIVARNIIAVCFFVLFLLLSSPPLAPLYPPQIPGTRIPGPATGVPGPGSGTPVPAPVVLIPGTGSQVSGPRSRDPGAPDPGAQNIFLKNKYFTYFDSFLQIADAATSMLKPCTCV